MAVGADAQLWAWLLPSILAAAGLTSGELATRALITYFRADPNEYTTVDASLLLGGVSIAALALSPDGLLAALNQVPWYWAAIIGALRVGWTLAMTISVQYAPNPGFAKILVNLNAVFAVVVGVAVFGGTVNTTQLVGVALSLAGGILCTLAPAAPSAAAKKSDDDPAAKAPRNQGSSWAIAGLGAALLCVTGEMSSRWLTLKHDGDPAIFTQATLGMGAPLAVPALLRSMQARSQGTVTAGRVPIYVTVALSLLRMQNQVWVMEAVQNNANPGLSKTMINGLNTVLATIAGVIFFGSQLSVQAVAGVALALAGTYLTTADPE